MRVTPEQIRFELTSLKAELTAAIKNFLMHHGMICMHVNEIVGYGDGKVVISNINMANSDYTKALGLLLLLFTEHNPYLYLSFGDGIITIEDKDGSKPHDDLKKGIEYIKKRMNVKINY